MPSSISQRGPLKRWDRCPTIPASAIAGGNGPARSVPTGSCSATTTNGKPIGPEPIADHPDKRALWHEAWRALGPAGETDLRDRADGSLWLIRDQYQAETAWAPKHVGRELGYVRASAEDARLQVIRSEAEADVARKAADHELAARHEQQAERSRLQESAYRTQENILAGLMDDRRAWEAATEPQRRLAVAADAELRRRYPEMRIEPLRSAEPERGHRRAESRAGRAARGAARLPAPGLGAGAGRDAEGVQREDRRTAKPHGTTRRPRLGGPGPGVPRLAATRPGRRAPAAQAADPAIGAPRRARSRSWRTRVLSVTMAGKEVALMQPPTWMTGPSWFLVTGLPWPEDQPDAELAEAALAIAPYVTEVVRPVRPGRRACPARN